MMIGWLLMVSLIAFTFCIVCIADVLTVGSYRVIFALWSSKFTSTTSAPFILSPHITSSNLPLAFVTIGYVR
jgi:hypothetical protein